jgi:phosphohistidine phosphatase
VSVAVRLFFLRHGRAMARADWSGDDDLRPLTPEGEAAMAREARTIAAMDLGLKVIITSPLARARRTAEIVAEAAGGGVSVVEDERLAGGFDVKALRAVVAEHGTPKALMLVGHEPDFSTVVGALIGGGRVVCKKGGLARVDAADGDLKAAELAWLLPPSQLGGG